eukprot:102135-Chlamydomonas_euryale.AAC.1
MASEIGSARSAKSVPAAWASACRCNRTEPMPAMRAAKAASRAAPTTNLRGPRASLVALAWEAVPSGLG